MSYVCDKCVRNLRRIRAKSSHAVREIRSVNIKVQHSSIMLLLQELRGKDSDINILKKKIKKVYTFLVIIPGKLHSCLKSATLLMIGKTFDYKMQ